MWQRQIHWQSLKLRLSLSTLAICLTILWSLSIYSYHLIRKDAERLIGEQQFATANLAADMINETITQQFVALERAAGEVGARSLLQDAPQLTDWIERQGALHELFNGAVFVTGTDGIPLASVPFSAKMLATSFADRDYLIATLRDGQRGIGKPILGRIRHTPIIGLAVPIRDQHGVVIGAVAGAIDLSQANLIERTVQRGVGKTGGFIVISHRDRVCVTATDKSRIMTAVPPANVNPLLDRFMEGFEGYGITLNVRGIEDLAASARIPVAD